MRTVLYSSKFFTSNSTGWFLSFAAAVIASFSASASYSWLLTATTVMPGEMPALNAGLSHSTSPMAPLLPIDRPIE